MQGALIELLLNACEMQAKAKRFSVEGKDLGKPGHSLGNAVTMVTDHMPTHIVTAVCSIMYLQLFAMRCC